MSSPQHMVGTSIIGTLVLLCGIAWYLWVYPKRNITFFTLLLLVSLLPLLSLLRPGDYESGDFNIHLYRIMSFYDTLKEGHLLPSWAAELNATYGNPLFVFNYPLPYYLVSLLHFSGLSFIDSMKVFLGIDLYFSGIFMYLWMRRLTSNDVAAFTAAIFYVFNPYHLIDIHFRATLGESTIFMLAPLLFYFMTRYVDEKRFLYLTVVSLLTGLLFLAHPLLAGAVVGIGIVYAMVTTLIRKRQRQFVLILLSIAAGVLASQYTWVPFFIYTDYMFQIPSHDFYFIPFQTLFYSPWMYGFLFQGHHGELALIIGYSQLFVLVASVLIIGLKRAPRTIMPLYGLWVFMTLVLILLMHPASQPFWNHFYMFFNMFIPYGRLLLPIALCTSVVAGYLVLTLPNSKRATVFVYLLIAVTIGTTILNWGHRRVIPEINDTILRHGVWRSTMTEGVTAYFLNNRWADIHNFWFSVLPKEHLQILRGVGEVKQVRRTSTEHTYVVRAQTALTIQENTLFFPGWTLRSNETPINIHPGYRGVITASLPKGLQYLTLSYQDIWAYSASKTLGVSMFLTIIILFCFSLVSWCNECSKHRAH